MGCRLRLPRRVRRQRRRRRVGLACPPRSCNTFNSSSNRCRRSSSPTGGAGPRTGGEVIVCFGDESPSSNVPFQPEVVVLVVCVCARARHAVAVVGWWGLFVGALSYRQYVIVQLCGCPCQSRSLPCGGCRRGVVVVRWFRLPTAAALSCHCTSQSVCWRTCVCVCMSLCVLVFCYRASLFALMPFVVLVAAGDAFALTLMPLPVVRGGDVGPPPPSQTWITALKRVHTPTAPLLLIPRPPPRPALPPTSPRARPAGRAPAHRQQTPATSHRW